MIERRTYPRVEVSCPVLYFSDIHPRGKLLSTLNLSMGGARIKTAYSLMMGETIELTLAIQEKEEAL